MKKGQKETKNQLKIDLKQLLRTSTIEFERIFQRNLNSSWFLLWFSVFSRKFRRKLFFRFSCSVSFSLSSCSTNNVRHLFLVLFQNTFCLQSSSSLSNQKKKKLFSESFVCIQNFLSEFMLWVGWLVLIKISCACVFSLHFSFSQCESVYEWNYEDLTLSELQNLKKVW